VAGEVGAALMAVGPAGMSVKAVCTWFDPRRVETSSGET
jgi:hypothetical protein